MSKISGGERFVLKRAGIPPEMLESAMGEIHHAHEMLRNMVPREEHDKIHDSCKTSDYEKVFKNRPEFATYILEGACMYRLICYMHFSKCGIDEFNRVKLECANND